MLHLPECAHYLPVPLCEMLSFEALKGLPEWLCDQLTLKAGLVSTTESVHSVPFSLTVESERFVGRWSRADCEPPVHFFHHSELGWPSFFSSVLTNPEKAIPRFGTSPVPRPMYNSPLDRRREPASLLSTSSQTLVFSNALLHRVSLETVSAV